VGLTLKVRRAHIYEIKLCSLEIDVAPHRNQNHKKTLLLLKEKKIGYKIICYTLYLGLSQLSEIEIQS